VNPLVGYPPLAVAVPTPEVTVSDRVRTPDGHVGEVIGFYRAEQDAVLVRFDSGDRRQYLSADLWLLG
jgi:hypothetical protein